MRAAGARKPPAPEPERALPQVVKHESAAGEPQDPPDDLKEKSFHLDIERAILDGTNRERAKRDLPPLVWSDDAAKAARYQSRCLAKHKLLGHDTLPCGSLRGRLDLFAIAFLGAENLDFVDLPGPLDKTTLRGRLIVSPGGPPPEHVLADAIVEDWLESPHHRENLLSSEETDLGVGVYWGDGKIYATQVFFKRMDCGVAGTLCCPSPTGGRYCYAPYACDVKLDVCKR